MRITFEAGNGRLVVSGLRPLAILLECFGPLTSEELVMQTICPPRPCPSCMSTRVHVKVEETETGVEVAITCLSCNHRERGSYAGVLTPKCLEWERLDG